MIGSAPDTTVQHTYHARELSEKLLMPHGSLGFLGNVGHGADTIQRIVSLCGFSAKHDAIGTIEDSVGYIRALSTGGTRFRDHGLEHLSGTNDGFASLIAPSDHALLGQEDFLGRDFNTKITTSNHDTVGCFDNLVEVVNTLVVLDLGDDENVFALLAYYQE
jgi:hypothetical protein